MKTLIFGLLLCTSALAKGNTRSEGIPDLPPDSPSSAYQAALSLQAKLFEWPGNSDNLDIVFSVGERNLGLLKAINAGRPEGAKLSLTSKENAVGYPIDKPNEYNPSIILKSFEELKGQLPAELKEIVFGKGAFPSNPPIAEADYLKWSWKLDRAYQSASRWRTMKGFLPALEARRSSDIRGYYFLSRMKNREAKLQAPSKLSAEEKIQVQDWLLGMCINNGTSTKSCRGLVEAAFKANQDLNPLYLNWKDKSAEIYGDYFAIPAYAPRTDFKWERLSNGGEQFITPFTDPKDPAVRSFMQGNIEDEWHFGSWSLRFPFTSERGHAYVVFRPDVTPHVNGLGGSEITMNSKQPLTEYDAQWTIRHEFGHVLGLPDCYVEFYVPERSTIINYQIDTTNIMCSRQGHVKQSNVDELRRIYGN